jgi:signal transduction histidine kinase
MVSVVGDILGVCRSDVGLRELLGAFYQQLARLMPPHSLYVALYDPVSELYTFPINEDDDDEDFAPQQLRKSLTDYVRRTQRPLLCTEAVHQRLRDEGEVEVIGVPSPVWLGVPLRPTDRAAIGVAVVQHYEDEAAYDDRDLADFALLADTIASAVDVRWRTEDAAAREQAQRLGTNAEAADLPAMLAKTAFLANMSHEMRTPLNAILGYTEMLAEDLGETDAGPDLERVHASALHLLGLVDDVLELARIESGDIEMQASRFLVAGAVEEAAQVMSAALARSTNKLVLVGLEGAGTLDGDRAKLVRCVASLIGNAAKFTTDGTISVRGRRTDGHVVIEVADTGQGIDPARLARVFDPFTRVDETSTRRTGGAGLGLALTRELVTAMGGEITARSVPGEGSTFALELPIAIAEA